MYSIYDFTKEKKQTLRSTTFIRLSYDPVNRSVMNLKRLRNLLHAVAGCCIGLSDSCVSISGDFGVRDFGVIRDFGVRGILGSGLAI